MEAITIVFIMAIIVEAVIQVIKGWVPETATPAWLWPIASAVLGVILCLLGQVDVIALAGITLAVPFVGQVVTGILISRGASFMHDLWNRIRNGAGVIELTQEVAIEDEPPDADA